MGGLSVVTGWSNLERCRVVVFFSDESEFHM